MHNIDWYLADDGTLDTVIAIECPHCDRTFEVRFDAEFSIDCRDEDTGTLDMVSFDEIVQLETFTCDHCGSEI